MLNISTTFVYLLKLIKWRSSIKCSNIWNHSRGEFITKPTQQVNSAIFRDNVGFSDTLGNREFVIEKASVLLQVIGENLFTSGLLRFKATASHRALRKKITQAQTNLSIDV